MIPPGKRHGHYFSWRSIANPSILVALILVLLYLFFVLCWCFIEMRSGIMLFKGTLGLMLLVCIVSLFLFRSRFLQDKPLSCFKWNTKADRFSYAKGNAWLHRIRWEWVWAGVLGRVWGQWENVLAWWVLSLSISCFCFSLSFRSYSTINTTITTISSCDDDAIFHAPTHRY